MGLMSGTCLVASRNGFAFCLWQAPVDVVALIDAAEALTLPASVMDIIAARFLDVPCVSWSDAYAAGIRGRDIVQLRRHLAGEVCPRWAQFTVDATVWSSYCSPVVTLSVIVDACVQ